MAFRFCKNQENSVFGTQLVATTSELNLTGSTYYDVTHQFCAVFRFKKKYRYFKISSFVGGFGVIITILTLKTGLLTVFFTEKRYRSIKIGCINSNTSIIIPLRVFSISELRCLSRKFATRWRVTPTDLYLNFCTKRYTKLVNVTQHSIVGALEPLLIAPCTDCRISLLL